MLDEIVSTRISSCIKTPIVEYSYFISDRRDKIIVSFLEIKIEWNKIAWENK